MTQTQNPQAIAVNSAKTSTLYDLDLAIWIETTVELLKEKKFTELDVEPQFTPEQVLDSEFFP